MNRHSGSRSRVMRGYGIQWALLLQLLLAVCAAALMPSSAAGALSSNANLSGIGFTQGGMTPSFSANTLSYNVALGNSTPSTGIQAYLEDHPLSQMTITTAAGTSTLQHGVIRLIPLDVGPNVVTIHVTAEDGTTKDYTVTITRAAPPPNLNLSFLSLSSGFLNPGFSSSTLSYTATVGNAVDKIQVTPTAADAAATTITVNGATVASGTASGDIPLSVGTNAITVEVSAPSATPQTYNVTVTRSPPSSDNTLIGIGLSQGSLDQSFSPGTLSYTATVVNSVPAIRITPYAADTASTITVNGQTVASHTASSLIALTPGANTVTIEVLAPDGTGPKIYTLTVNRALSANADLGALIPSVGTMTPTFDAATTSYALSVPNANTAVNFTPYADPAASITVDGVPRTSGTASADVSLPTPLTPVTINVVVTAQDGTTTKTYQVIATRQGPPPPSADADLIGIGLSNSGLTPSFSAGQLNYTSSVGNSIPSIRVTPYASDTAATITVNGDPVTSHAQSNAISLVVGDNPITIVVKSPNNAVTKTYTVTLNRAPSSNADLAGLDLSRGTLSPSFASGTTGYSASVTGISEITVRPTLADPTATVRVNGTLVATTTASDPISLAVGANTISVVVTAQDLTTVKTYTLSVTRIRSSVADLANLSLSGAALSPSFTTGTTGYTASVANSISTITVTPTVTDSLSTVTVNNTTVASGTASTPIPLVVGPNTITTVVTAEDGTTKTYTTTVTRAASADATLSALSLSSGTLSPSFATGTKTYTASVADAVTSVTVTPTAAAPGAAITVNTIAVASGAASTAIPLVVGANVITTVVTAADGVTTDTYTITVTRAAPASTDASLSGLVLSSGTLAPSFVSGTTAYTASVGNAVSTLTLTPTVSALGASVAVNGNPVTTGTASTPLSLVVGANVITTVVTAPDGVTTDTYTITVTRAAPASTDASLSGLVLSSGTLAPSFVSGTTAYTASVGNAVSTLTLTPTVSALGASVAVNGNPVTTGTASTPISLVVGANVVTTVVTAPDGVTQQTYTVTVQRAAATIVTLTPSAGALPVATKGTAYNQPLTAAGGTAPYSYAVTAGALPAGIVLDPSTGALGGTPGASGDFSFTVTATDGANVAGSAAYTLKVKIADASFAFSPAGGALKDAMAGEDYSQPISATGGSGALIYSLASGTLPKGLVLNVSTGELTGPLAADATAGDYAFSIQVTDGNGSTGNAAFTLMVKAQAVTASDIVVEVPAGSTPNNVYLNRGATGGPFTGADLAFVEPANAGTATIIRGELAQAGPAATPAGWYLKFAPDPAYSGTVRVGYRLVGALGTSNTGVVTYKLIHDAAEVASDIDALVHGFVEARQNMISSSIKVPGLLERRQMMEATDPVTARMTPSEDGMAATFSTSLNQMEAARNHADGVSGGVLSPFNIWIDGVLLAHKRDQNDGKWGSFAMINLGADYLLNERALVGFSLHFDRMTDPADADAELTGNGWLAGPYASLEVGRNLFWNASLRYGGSSNDIDTAFWDGTFDTTRWMADTSLEGRWDIDEQTVLTPKLRVVYFSETVDDYAVKDASGNTIAVEGFDEEQFRVSLGAEIARSFTLESGAKVTPKLGVTGGFSALDGSGAFAALTAGVSVETADFWMLEASLLLNVAEEGETSAGGRIRAAKQF
ncbi:UNVERIFIED_ORG: cadherin-like beta sandwich domain-containing protein (plasmid) [Roseateles sp. XES5]|nr:cadherin-like beta sandwich domain-containing protein [Roseateles sp. XES5]